MSEKNNPAIPQKDHLAPGDDPRDVLRQHEAAPPHAKEQAPARENRVTDKDKEDEDEEPTE